MEHEALDAASATVTAPLTRDGEAYPAHLLFEDCSPILSDIQTEKKKKKKKAGWGLKYSAGAGASAEDRGVTEISFSQLQSSIERQQNAQPAAAAIANAMDVDEEAAAGGEEEEDVLRPHGRVRHQQNRVVHEDDE